MRTIRSRPNRRELLTGVAAGLALGLLARAGGAVGAPIKLDPDEPIAVALGYRPEGARSERPAADQACRACVQFSATADPSWGQCAIFAGRLVRAGGWCRAYARRG